MDKRMIWGVMAAVGTQLLLGLLATLTKLRNATEVMTPLGALPLLDLAIVLLAMALGAIVAQRRFHWIALALVAVQWAISLFALVTIAGTGPDAPVSPWASALRWNALAIGLSLVVAFGGAWLGERHRGRFARVAADAR